MTNQSYAYVPPRSASTGVGALEQTRRGEYDPESVWHYVSDDDDLVALCGSRLLGIDVPDEEPEKDGCVVCIELERNAP